MDVAVGGAAASTTIVRRDPKQDRGVATLRTPKAVYATSVTPRTSMIGPSWAGTGSADSRCRWSTLYLGDGALKT